MIEFLPSEIARLVLGYLEETDCKSSYNMFLLESPLLLECKLLSKLGRQFRTTVGDYTLLAILDEYCKVKSENGNGSSEILCSRCSSKTSTALIPASKPSATKQELSIVPANNCEVTENSSSTISNYAPLDHNDSFSEAEVIDIKPDISQLCSFDEDTQTHLNKQPHDTKTDDQNGALDKIVSQSAIGNNIHLESLIDLPQPIKFSERVLVPSESNESDILLGQANNKINTNKEVVVAKSLSLQNVIGIYAEENGTQKAIAMPQSLTKDLVPVPKKINVPRILPPILPRIVDFSHVINPNTANAVQTEGTPKTALNEGVEQLIVPDVLEDVLSPSNSSTENLDNPLMLNISTDSTRSTMVPPLQTTCFVMGGLNNQCLLPVSSIKSANSQFQLRKMQSKKPRKKRQYFKLPKREKNIFVLSNNITPTHKSEDKRPSEQSSDSDMKKKFKIDIAAMIQERERKKMEAVTSDADVQNDSAECTIVDSDHPTGRYDRTYSKRDRICKFVEAFDPLSEEKISEVKICLSSSSDDELSI